MPYSAGHSGGGQERVRAGDGDRHPGGLLSAPARALQELWRTDAIGICDAPLASPLSMEDDDAVRQYREGL